MAMNSTQPRRLTRSESGSPRHSPCCRPGPDERHSGHHSAETGQTTTSGVTWWDGGVVPEERFAAVIEVASGEPDVQLPGGAGGRRFGSESVRLGGSIVAMLVQGRVVLKLPRDRVDALIAAGDGAPFDNGRGRPMREWVALTGDPAGDAGLLREALDLARSRVQSG
jgi:hypothetical protein